jgi:hypothetical protein
MDYSFKRGFKPDLERIQKALEEEFPTEIKQEDGKLLLSYGALKSICVSITGKKLTVTTESVIGHGYQQALPKFPGKSHRLQRQAEAADGQKRGNQRSLIDWRADLADQGDVRPPPPLPALRSMRLPFAPARLRLGLIVLFSRIDE